jgi:hypothetical protein
MVIRVQREPLAPSVLVYIMHTYHGPKLASILSKRHLFQEAMCHNVRLCLHAVA